MQMLKGKHQELQRMRAAISELRQLELGAQVPTQEIQAVVTGAPALAEEEEVDDDDEEEGEEPDDAEEQARLFPLTMRTAIPSRVGTLVVHR